MTKRIIECVPNFSEGRDKAVIDSIVKAIAAVEGVSVLNVDPGEATNRTVVTFVGEPEAVVEGAFQGVKKAQELIDMTKHHGAHPRIGATDVLPLIPVDGITLEECAAMARQLAERISTDLSIPTYCYEAAAFRPERKNLAVCRKGEYEGLRDRVAKSATVPADSPSATVPADSPSATVAADSVGGSDAPDFGNRPWDEVMAKSGATVVGARDFLIAVNFNLNTTSTRRANAIAFDVREKGRPMRQGPKVTDKPVLDEQGNKVWLPGTLKGTKAIGWYIDEYGIAQVSMNITDINTTPLHVAFDEVCRAAQARGLRVTGTEIVGLVPRRCLIEAGKYFLKKQQRSVGIADEEIIRIAIKSMGLDELRPFLPEEKVIEDVMVASVPFSAISSPSLINTTCRAFAQETASESPAPGGGSISAYMGALAAALGTMVANLSAHKPGWDDEWERFSDTAESGQALLKELLALVDEDTAAFNRIMDAFKLPKGTDEEKAARSAAIQSATLYATEVPLRTMKAAAKTFPLLKDMAEHGNPASVSDAGVGALAARSAVLGARLNVKINAAGLKDRTKADALVAEAEAIAQQAIAAEAEIITIAESKI